MYNPICYSATSEPAHPSNTDWPAYGGTLCCVPLRAPCRACPGTVSCGNHSHSHLCHGHYDEEVQSEFHFMSCFCMHASIERCLGVSLHNVYGALSMRYETMSLD